MHIHFLIHESFEAPGVYMEWAKESGYKVTQTNLYNGQALPKAADADMLIVMGGPQGPYTTVEECPYFDAKAEIALMQDYINEDKPVVGVCLGAQLLGEAYGATVERSPEKEIGNFPIFLTEAGKKNALMSGFKDGLVTGHWHGDMPGLPDSAVVLATSKGCPRQIIQFGEKQFGFQCHLEFSKELVAALIAEEDNLDGEARQRQFVQVSSDILSYDYSEMNQTLKDFLTKLVRK